MIFQGNFATKGTLTLCLFLCLFFLSVGGVDAAGFYPEVNSTMILYMHFNDINGSNVTSDNSTSAFNGTVYNATYNSTGGFLGDGAFEFSGVDLTQNSSIRFGNVLSIPAIDAWTICSWAKFNDTTSVSYIFAKYPNGAPEYGFYREASADLRFQVRNSTSNFVLRSGFTPIRNVYYWLCVQTNQSSGNHSIYVNSILKNYSVGTANAISPSSNFTIGAKIHQSNANTFAMNGTIDEFIIWNSSLSRAQIYSIYRDYREYVPLERNLSFYNNTNISNATTYFINSSVFHDTSYLMSVESPNITINFLGTRVNGSYNNIFEWTTLLSIRATNVTVINSNITNYYVAISSDVGANSSNISYNNIYYTGQIGISINSSSSFVESNNLSYSYDNINGYGIQLFFNTTLNSVKNNRLLDGFWDPIQIQGINSNITGNYIQKGNHRIIDLLCNNFDYSACSGNIIENNTGNRTVNGFEVPNPYSNYVYMYASQGNIFRHNSFFGGTGGIGSAIGIQGNSTRQSINNLFYNNSWDNISADYLFISDAINNTFYNESITNWNTNGSHSLIDLEASTGINTTFSPSNLSGYNLIDVATIGSFKGHVNAYNNYSQINNTNTTNSHSIAIYNLTNALIYNTNNTVYGSTNISTNDGNVNITLQAGNSSYVLDNFNLTEGITRTNSPLNLSNTTNFYKTVNSTLSNTINTTFVFNSANCSISNITHPGFSHPDTYFSCVSNVVTLAMPLQPGITNVSINYIATSSTVIGSGGGGAPITLLPASSSNVSNSTNATAEGNQTAEDDSQDGLTGNVIQDFTEWVGISKSVFIFVVIFAVIIFFIVPRSQKKNY